MPRRSGRESVLVGRRRRPSPEGSLMRRIPLMLIVAFVCLAGLTLAPGAGAGDFADEPCNNVSGDNYTCPPATTGNAYSLDIQLKEPWPGCTNMFVSSGEFPPGLSIDGDGRIRGTPSRAGGYTFYLTVTWSNTSPCITQPSPGS